MIPEYKDDEIEKLRECAAEKTFREALAGTNPKDLLGRKKPPMHLVPAILSVWVAKVFGVSSKKYGKYNWRSKKVIKSIYLDAIERHLQALKDGEEVARDTGYPHAAHIASNCAILLDAQHTGCLVDDMTWPVGAAGRVIEELTED